MNYLIAFPGCSFFTLLRSNECTASRRRAVNPLVTSRFNAGYINVSSKLPEHKCNSDTAISRWSRRRPTASALAPRHVEDTPALKRKSNAISFVPGLSSPSVRPYSILLRMHAGQSAVFASPFSGISPISSLFSISLSLPLSLSLSLLCNDRPSPPGTS